MPVLRCRLQPHAPRPGRPDRQGDLSRRPRRHPRQPLHQGPLRLRLREEPQARVTVELASLEELEPALAREKFDVARVFVGYGASAPSAPEPCRIPKLAYSLDRPGAPTGSLPAGGGDRTLPPAPSAAGSGTRPGVPPPTRTRSAGCGRRSARATSTR